MAGLWDYLSSWTSGLIGNGHLLTAIIALASGAAVLTMRKGTRTHRWLGYSYVIAMLSVNGTALVKYDLTGGFNLFHGAAIASLVTLILAYGCIWLFKQRRDRKYIAMHGSFMIWSYFGLVMALIAEVVTRKFPYMLHGDGGWTRFTVALAALMIVSGYGTHLYANWSVRRYLPR